MNIAEAAIRAKTFTLVLTVMSVLGGLYAYTKLGRLEDPEFTVKNAQVVTDYPGASAAEVAEEVTDVLETAIQQMGQLKEITSTSLPGRSIILVEMEDKYDRASLPQVWDELRRKVNDARGQLPPGASEPLVNDDYGDVYGVFYAVYGDGFTYADLKQHADMLRRELLLCTDVAKISFWGELPEVVYVELSRARLTQLGLSPEQVFSALSGQNLVVNAGNVTVDTQYVRIDPTGGIRTIEDIGNTLVLTGDASQPKLYLRDIATITRGYADPPQTIMRYNGRPAIGLGISTKIGGNVVTMGQSVDNRLRQLVADTPIGIEVGVISHQSESVTTSINGFVVSLIEAIAIVVGVLMLAMGLRSGLLIGFILLQTVTVTFIVMLMNGVMLERISLGALIIALGMLVDNAIVVVEGVLVGMQKGESPTKAAADIVKQTIWPLMGATIVAILAFAAIGASQDSTGEFCRSLYQVILYSLLASWVLAITVTPLLGVMTLKVKPTAAGEAAPDPYGGLLFRGYRAFLEASLRWRWTTIIILAVMLVLAIVGFGRVDKSFFPESTRPQFMVHCWFPQGSHIDATSAAVAALENAISDYDGVAGVSTFVGRGALRFILTYTPENPNAGYALLLVDVDDVAKMDDLIEQVETYARDHVLDAQVFGRKFVLGPGEAQKIHARFRGPDADVLRDLSQQARQLMRAQPYLRDVVDDWRDRVPVARPIVADTAARNAGVTRAQVAAATSYAFGGMQVGVYREADDLLPIIARAPLAESRDVANLIDAPIYSPVAGRAVPLRQVVRDVATVSEDQQVQRRYRLPTITVKCDPIAGITAVQALDELRPLVEAIPIPAGYSLEWGGEYEDSGKAQAGLMAKIPPILILMVLIVIGLFNSLRQPLIIFLTVPLAVIGVTTGLLMFDQPFGFMALLGFLSLAGMQIKNAIVLIDEIKLQIGTGKDAYLALVESGVSRVRPVSMAALTTVLGMIPLLPDVFFAAMAVTIMVGLTFATVLTLIVIPVLYALIYRIPTPARR